MQLIIGSKFEAAPFKSFFLNSQVFTWLFKIMF